MPKTITTTTTVYTFDELNDKAKDVAREWFREALSGDEWWQSTYEDAENIGLVISAFDCDRGTIEAKLTGSIGETCRRIFKDHGHECGTYKLAQCYYATRHAGKAYSREEFTNDLAQEYLKMLRDEYEYLQSNESIDENIRYNEYEFTENGKRF